MNRIFIQGAVQFQTEKNCHRVKFRPERRTQDQITDHLSTKGAGGKMGQRNSVKEDRLEDTRQRKVSKSWGDNRNRAEETQESHSERTEGGREK